MVHGGLDQPPDVLAHQGREYAAAFGYPERPADSAVFLRWSYLTEGAEEKKLCMDSGRFEGTPRSTSGPDCFGLRYFGTRSPLSRCRYDFGYDSM